MKVAEEEERRGERTLEVSTWVRITEANTRRWDVELWGPEKMKCCTALWRHGCRTRSASGSFTLLSLNFIILLYEHE